MLRVCAYGRAAQVFRRPADHWRAPKAQWVLLEVLAAEPGGRAMSVGYRRTHNLPAASTALVTGDF